MATGVDSNGQLKAFVFVDGSADPERVGRLSEKDHSWIPFLKDCTTSATFAVFVAECLAFPYPNWGNKCRALSRITPTHSVLETALRPEAVSRLKDNSWATSVSIDNHILLSSSNDKELKVLKYLPHHQLLLGYTKQYLIRTIVARIWGAAEMGFLEVLEKKEYHTLEERVSTIVYISSNEYALELAFLGLVSRISLVLMGARPA